MTSEKLSYSMDDQMFALLSQLQTIQHRMSRFDCNNNLKPDSKELTKIKDWTDSLPKYSVDEETRLCERNKAFGLFERKLDCTEQNVLFVSKLKQLNFSSISKRGKCRIEQTEDFVEHGNCGALGSIKMDLEQRLNELKKETNENEGTFAERLFKKGRKMALFHAYHFHTIDDKEVRYMQLLDIFGLDKLAVTLRLRKIQYNAMTDSITTEDLKYLTVLFASLDLLPSNLMPDSSYDKSAISPLDKEENSFGLVVRSNLQMNFTLSRVEEILCLLFSEFAGRKMVKCEEVATNNEMWLRLSFSYYFVHHQLLIIKSLTDFILLTILRNVVYVYYFREKNERL